MGGRLCLTLHAAVPAGDSLGGELARWREAAGGGEAAPPHAHTQSPAAGMQMTRP